MPEVIPASELHRYLVCDFETGKLFWKERSMDMFDQDFVGKRWNDRYAGKEAFTSSHNGYFLGRIHKRGYQAHRVVFAMFHGRWPGELLDHIDLDKTNNRPENLREATRLQNAWNKSLTAQNSSGFKGVSYDRATGRWCAQIWQNGKHHFLGRFDTPESAAFAYDAKARKLHGEFAKLNFPECPILDVAAYAITDNNRRYKRTGPVDHPNLRTVNGELRCYL